MTGIRIFGDHDEKTVAQLERCVAAEEGARGVLCADGHLGYSQPIGGVVAYREHVSPSGAGYDIGCGNKAVRTPLRAEELRPDLPRVMDAVVHRISFGVGRSAGVKADHPILDDIRATDFPLQRKLYDLAADQLGTVGAGNHFVCLFEDEAGFVWVGVHFGSRGFGHKTASFFFDDKGGMEAPPTLLHDKTDLGQQYIAAMDLAARYAFAGRDVVVDTVLDILGTHATDEIHNNHNQIWREEHDGEQWWVVRKGATPAFPGQRGFVGASMGEPSVILEGTEEARGALYSTV